MDPVRLKLEIERMLRQQIEDERHHLQLQDQNRALLQTLAQWEEQPTILADPAELTPDTPQQAEHLLLKSAGGWLLHRYLARLLRVILLTWGFRGQHDFLKSGQFASSIHLAEWDFVIAFPNPDFQADPEKPKTPSSVSKKQIARLFTESIKPKRSRALNQQRENSAIEQEAFEYALQQIKDFHASDGHRQLEDEADEPKARGKLWNAGGRIYRSEEGYFVDSEAPASDCLSLFRTITLYKLSAHLGLRTMQMLSSHGKYIYVLVHVDENLLEAEAERIQYKVEFEIGATDIISLEPCDKLLRPMRNIEPKSESAIIRTIESIKQLSIELAPHFDKMFAGYRLIESDEDKQDPYKHFPEEWQAYERYLRALYDRLQAEETAPNYKSILLDALAQANRGVAKKHRLYNLWGRIGILQPFGAFASYTQSRDPITSEDKFDSYWKRHRVCESGRVSKFRNADKFKLLTSLIFRQVSLHILKGKGILVDYFPLANSWQLTSRPLFLPSIADSKPIAPIDGLLNKWNAPWYSMNIPLSAVRNYFGEKIGFYFAFTSYLGKSLLWPSAFGLVIFILQRVFDHNTPIVLVGNALFCLYMVVWATLFMESWARRQSSIAIRWGQVDRVNEEVPRPEFQGKLSRSPITNELEEVYYSPIKRWKWYIIALCTSIGLLALALSLVAGIYILRFNTSLVYSGIDFAGPLCSGLNAVQIQTFNYIYYKIAVKLTDMENHHLPSSYESSLILKTYVFHFLNSFNTLFYIAFIKTHYEGCVVTTDDGTSREQGASCLDELYLQLITLFLVAFLKNLSEVGVPYIEYLWKHRKFRRLQAHCVHMYPERSNLRTLRDTLDHQIQLPEYNKQSVEGVFWEYLEESELFGYISLFAVAFPVASFLAYISLLIELRVDRFKLLELVRRPTPQDAKTIGGWYDVFNFICIVSVFTNIGVFCFTANTFENWEFARENRFVIYSVLCVILIGFRGSIKNFVPNLSKRYLTMMKRHKVIVQKLLREWKTLSNRGLKDKVYLSPDIYCTFKDSVH